MRTNLNSNRPRGALIGLVGSYCLGLAWAATGQPATYTYDGAGNAAGTVPGAPSAPAFTTPPQSQLLESNSFASFSVVASGSGLSYQWLSNGIPILGATGDSLIVANLPLTGTNLGNFSVIITNAHGAITSAPAALWPDANGNGIPDWWELKYFGNLNQAAAGDSDGDGVDNFHEYLEGTNPTNRLSFNPRLDLYAVHGSVSAAPSLPYYSLGQLVTLTAAPDSGREFVNWSGGVTGTKSTISFFMSTNKSVTANFGFPLAVALDNTNLVWTTGGSNVWFGQAEVSKDGVNAARSGAIVSYYDGSTFTGEQTWLQTSFLLSQPEQLGFWWEVSSQAPDGVTFSINGVTAATLSGETVPWQNLQTNLPAGVYTLRWTYSKGPVNIPNGIPFTDAAWVDQVTLTTATPLAPVLDIQPTGVNAVLLSWPVSSSAFRLQQTAALSPANWTNTTNAVIVANGTNQTFITAAGSSQFYRLVFP